MGDEIDTRKNCTYSILLRASVLIIIFVNRDALTNLPYQIF